MISLPFLWKWLYINYTPLEEGEEEGGISKEDLVKELLASKEVDKEGNEQAAIFAKALIGRYLCLLFKNSAQCKNRFTDPKRPAYFSLKKLEEEEKERRASDVPPFPDDLRLRILKELREERLGRSSARNLLQLMTQPPNKKKSRTMENADKQQMMPPDIVPITGSPEEGAANTSGMLSPPASPNRRTLKRSASGELAGGAAEKRRELPPSSSAAAGHAAPYRALRKQVSSPVLTQGKGAAASGGAVPPLFAQQEPWKREINDLWAKQLAMMREINTLKVELGRREAARQREILAMRQELDVMRAEIFRLRQVHGVGPLPAAVHGKEGKEGEEGAEVAAAVDETASVEPEKVGEEGVEMDTSIGEEEKAAAVPEATENN